MRVRTGLVFYTEKKMAEELSKIKWTLYYNIRYKNCRQKINLGWVILERDDAGINHFVVQIITFTGSLTHSGKHRVTTMSLGYVVDQLHDEDSLSNTSTSKQTNLSSLGVWGEQVHHFDSSFKDFLSATGISELWWGGVDGCKTENKLFVVKIRLVLISGWPKVFWNFSPGFLNFFQVFRIFSRFY